mmetsp:Transcript_77801/g.252125  ORF Transcript_77801/g.252125 Transcript_77801/m.252125 type:complete len:359 (+) Transcript_77801:2563-3639(+)
MAAVRRRWTRTHCSGGWRPRSGSGSRPRPASARSSRASGRRRRRGERRRRTSARRRRRRQGSGEPLRTREDRPMRTSGDESRRTFAEVLQLRGRSSHRELPWRQRRRGLAAGTAAAERSPGRSRRPLRALPGASPSTARPRRPPTMPPAPPPSPSPRSPPLPSLRRTLVPPGRAREAPARARGAPPSWAPAGVAWPASTTWQAWPVATSGPRCCHRTTIRAPPWARRRLWSSSRCPRTCGRFRRRGTCRAEVEPWMRRRRGSAGSSSPSWSRRRSGCSPWRRPHSVVAAPWRVRTAPYEMRRGTTKAARPSGPRTLATRSGACPRARDSALAPVPCSSAPGPRRCRARRGRRRAARWP